MSEQKVRSVEEVAAALDATARGSRKVVHCHGCFDLLHVGHIKHLQAARRMGDVLVVTVTSDQHVDKGPGRPVFPERLRAEALAALDCVDFVAINRWATAVEAIRLLRPDSYVKGQEFANLARPPVRLQAEIDAVHAVGGDVRFTHEAVFSSTALLNTHAAKEDASSAARPFLDAFRLRHSADDVLSGLDTLQRLRALVIGEAIIDEYNYCVPLGKSPKEAVVTTKYVRQERHAGGALAVANHVAGVCRDVDLVAMLGGEDSQDAFVRSHLRSNVTPHFVIRPDAPTITRRRYMWDPSLVKMFEVAVMNDAPIPADLEDDMLAYLDGALPAYDVVIVADYGHGFLGSRAAAALAARARVLAVNTQANAANLGFNLITKYPRASYACIDEPEIRLATGDRWSPVGELADRVCAQLGCEAVSVTRGREGALTSGRDGTRWDLPVLSDAVIDRMGAGDACLAVTSLCVAAGMPLDMVALVGGIVGSLAVEVVGNRSSVHAAGIRERVIALLR